MFLLIVAAVWGISFVLTKNTLAEVTPLAFVFCRFAIAFVSMIALSWKWLKKLTLRVVKHGIAQGLMLLIGIVLQVMGLGHTTASNAAFITGLSVVFVPIFSSLLQKKLPGICSVAGVILSFVGLFFLSGGMEGFRSGINPGDIFCLIGSLGFSFHIILVDRLSEPDDFSLQTLFQVLTVLLGSGIAFAFSGESLPICRPVAAGVLFWTGIVGTAVAYTVQNWAQRNTNPTHTAMIVAAEPVFGVLFAAIIPGISGNTERLTLSGALGCAGILIAILITEAGPGILQKLRKKDENANHTI